MAWQRRGECYDVVVLGAGAAGLMCALTAGQRGLKVLVLERANKPGKKILMSGGGKCNFTNLEITPDHYLCGNPHFVKSALSRYSQWDFIALVEKHGIAYFEKRVHGEATGQLFCQESSKAILAMLLAECQEAGVDIRLRAELASVAFDEGFRLQWEGGAVVSPKLVVATGGLSVPSLGGSGFGYRLAEQFGHAVIAPRPGLVPVTLSGMLKDLGSELAGIALPVRLSTPTRSFLGDMLWTHRGLSGPAVLQISNFWQPGAPLWVDWLPGLDKEALLLESKRRHPQRLMKSILAPYLPRRLVGALEALIWSGQRQRPLGQWSDEAIRKTAGELGHWRLKPAGTEGYRTAEVTLGGVDSRDISSQTMESQKQPGLYFVGEVLDVAGQLGGFNFQWAWSSGFVAGQSL